MSADQLAAAKAAGDRAYSAHLAARPHDYTGAAKAAVDAQASHLLALHGSGRWQ